MPKAKNEHQNERSTSLRRDISKTVSATKNLRAISMSLVEKVRANAGVSSTEVANQLAKEAVGDVVGSVSLVSSDELLAVEKNIRRRLYDSLKVLVSIGAISRSRKDKTLTWVGVRHLVPQRFQAPASTRSPIANRAILKRSISGHRARLSGKYAQLSGLKAQLQALISLCQRNKYEPQPESTRIKMPFVLIRTPLSTSIKLKSSKDARNMVFDFQGYYELVNDSSILDRLFLVDGGQQSKVISNGSQTRSEAARLRRNRTADVLLQEEAEKGGFCSPKRQRVSSSSRFAKFTSGLKPPASASTPLRRDTWRQRGILQGSPPQVKWQDSPLGASLQMLAGQSPARLGTILDVEDSEISYGSQALLTPPRKRRTEFEIEGIPCVKDERVGFGHRMYGPQGQGNVEESPVDIGLPVEEGLLSAGSSPVNGLCSEVQCFKETKNRAARRLRLE